MAEYTQFRRWEEHLIWTWDQLEDADRGRLPVTADTLALAIVATVKAQLADADGMSPGRPARGSQRLEVAGGTPRSRTATTALAPDL